MKPESVRLPTFLSGVFSVWKRNFLQFKRFWLMNFFWTVLEPLLILLAIGYGLGAFIPNMRGIAYVDFFFPSLLCVSSMMVSFFEATYGNFAKLNNHKIYSTMILTPLEPSHVVVGETLWAATKGSISAIAVAIIAGIFGHLDNLMLIPSFVVIFLSSFLFAALGMVVTSTVKSHDGIIYPTSVFIVPMSLFSGTYFPIEHLPFGLKYLTYLFPLTHSVTLVRGLLLDGIIWWQGAIHLTCVIGLAGMCLYVAIKRITQKIIN